MANGRNDAAAVMALLLALSACKSEEPAPRLQVYGSDIASGWANVSVRRDGVPVPDATVVVNGVVLAPATFEAGAYSGPLPVPLAPGDPVALEVTSQGLHVTGAGALPHPPRLEFAYTSAAVASDGDIVVAWTSPSNPQTFDIAATWSCGPSCGIGQRFAAAGSARSVTIPAGSLPPGLDVDIAVFAYDDGSFEGDYQPWREYPGMNIRAESGSLPVATGMTGPPAPTLQVRGQDMGGSAASVIVERNGTAIDDAVVVVNGQVLPRLPDTHGAYSASLDMPVFAGEAVVLDVTSGALHVRGVGTLPDRPVLISPPDGAIFQAGHDVVVTWTSPTDPDYFAVSASWPCGPSCMAGTSLEVAGQSRTLTVPAGSIQATGAIGLQVLAYEDGAFTGDYSPYRLYPGMNLRADSNAISVSLTAP